MTISPLPLQVSPGYPEWDPMPRPPRRIASWIALALAGVTGVVAVGGASRIFGARYAVRADVCQALDLGPVGAALGRPGLSATEVSDPADPTGAARRSERICEFTVRQPDGALRAAGTATATWFDSAFLGKFVYESRQGQATNPNSRDAGPAELAGLGDRAFTHHKGEAWGTGFRVATLDSNLMLDLRVFVVPDGPAWSDGQAGPALTALTGALQASLPRLR